MQYLIESVGRYLVISLSTGFTSPGFLRNSLARKSIDVYKFRMACQIFLLSYVTLVVSIRQGLIQLLAWRAKIRGQVLMQMAYYHLCEIASESTH